MFNVKNTGCSTLKTKTFGGVAILDFRDFERINLKFYETNITLVGVYNLFTLARLGVG